MWWVVGAVPLVVLGPLLTVAERIAPEDEEAASRPRTAMWRRRGDWAFVAVQLALVPLVTALASSWAHLAVPHGPLRSAAASLPGPVRAGLAFALADVTAYWTHRAEHRWTRWWRVHAGHHRVERLDWLSGRRFHPVDLFAQVAMPIVVVGGAGVPIGSLTAYFAVAALVTLIAHCDVALPPTALDRVLVMPAYHRGHHEPGREDRNLAVVLPIVDVIFGTASFRGAPRPGKPETQDAVPVLSGLSG